LKTKAGHPVAKNRKVEIPDFCYIWLMLRFLKKMIVALLAAVLLAWGLHTVSQGDTRYFLQEQLSFGAWSQYDSIITAAAKENGIDFHLVKAVIWQESRFGADKIGGVGERGLIQVTEPAAIDWARANAVENFQPETLFDPTTNIRVGSWYLKRALDYYRDKDRPLPFALSEYNAGRGRVKRWTQTPDAESPPVSAEEMREKSFKSTRAYVRAIENRYAYYKKRAGEK